MGNTMKCTGSPPKSEKELTPQSERAWGDLNVEFIKIDVGSGVKREFSLCCCC